MKSQRYGRSHPRSGFTPEEDCLLVDLVAQFGNDSWTTIASYMEKRNARQCKDRYTSYLSPTINNGPYTEEEDDLLRQKYNEIGPKWVKISKFFPNRTDISVKCRWAVLNRRDMKIKEKKMSNIQSKSQKSKTFKKTNLDDCFDNNDPVNLSSTIDNDSVVNTKDDNNFDDSFSIGKNKNRSNGNSKKRNSLDSTPKSFGSTMTIRKRAKKRIDYNENNYEDKIDGDFDEISQSKESSPNAVESNSSFSTVSTPSSLTTTDTDSSTNSPGTNLSNSLPFASGEAKKSSKLPTEVTPNFSFEHNAQSQAAFIPFDNASSSSIFSFGPSPFFESVLPKSNDEVLMDNHAPFNSMLGPFPNQMMNTGFMKNENFNNFYNNYPIRNPTDGFIKVNNGYNNQGNHINNFNFNRKNNQLFQDRSTSIFAPSAMQGPNLNSFYNDKKKNFKSEEEIFAEDMNWDISWDASLADVKENPTSVNLFCNSYQSFE